MHRSTHVRAPAMLLLLGIVVGLAASGTSFRPPTMFLLVSALLGAGTACRLAGSKKHGTLWVACFLIAAISGFWAYGQLRFHSEPDPASLQLPEREATLSLRIERIFYESERFNNVSGIARVRSAPPVTRLQPGTDIYFRLTPPEDPADSIQRGQVLRTTGILHPIPEIEENDNDFDDYLKTIGVHYRFTRSSELAILSPPSRFDQFCTRMNERFQSYLRLGAPPDSDLAGVYVAMLLGRKAELSTDQSERYRMSGTMHFFAISGLHIGVIATVIAQFLLMIRVPRVIAPIIGLPLLYLYVEITGASPSAVRAFLMAAFFWASCAVQRQRSPCSALMASAVFVLIVAPANLWSIGFQLSYAVVFSILLFGLPLYESLTNRFSLWRWLPEANWTRIQHASVWTFDKVILLFAISLSAWLGSSLLTAGIFGFISPGAIFLNMLLVYFASLAIIGGVISLALALVGATLVAAFINHSAWLVISAMDLIILQGLRFPWTHLACEEFSLHLTYAGLGLYFGALCWLHRSASRLRSLHLVWPPMTLLATLLLGFAFQ